MVREELVEEDSVRVLAGAEGQRGQNMAGTAAEEEEEDDDTVAEDSTATVRSTEDEEEVRVVATGSL